MVSVVKCPRCGCESEATGKEWIYSVFQVKSFYCKQCDKKFNAYYRNNQLAYTIPKTPE